MDIVSGLMKKLQILLLIIYGFGIQTLFADYDYKSEEADWVDPGDMISFDPVLKRNRKSFSKDHSNDISKTKTNPCVENKSNYKSTTHSPVESSKCPDHKSHIMDTSKAECNHSQDTIFTKRFLLFYMRKLANVEKPKDYKEYELHVGLSKETWKKFEGFCDNSTKITVQEVLHELEHTFHHVSISKSDRMQQWRWRFEDYFHITAYEAFMVVTIVTLIVSAITLEVVSRIPWTKQFMRLLAIMLLISYISTYARMYQEEVAKQRASHDEVPEYCKGISSRSLYDKISSHMRYWFSIADDPCQKYHNAFNDPIFTVTPLKVLAATLSQFFLEPFEHIGTAFSRTFRNMFQDLSVQLWFLAFIFIILVMIAAILLLSVCFGYSWNLRLPFWTGFEIAPGANAIHARHNEQLLEAHRLQIENLQEVIRTLQENRPAIQAGGGQEHEGWGGKIRRMLNLGQNNENDEANINPNAAAPENPDPVEPRVPDPDIPLPAPNIDDNVPRRRHTAPYPPTNPPYPTGDNIAKSFAVPLLDNTNRIPKEAVGTFSGAPAKQRSCSAVANLEQASGEPQPGVEKHNEPIEIGFKRHIIAGCVPELPNYQQLMQATKKDDPGLKSPRAKTSPQKVPLVAHGGDSNEDKPCSSKTVLPQPKIKEASTLPPSVANNESCHETTATPTLSTMQKVTEQTVSPRLNEKEKNKTLSNESSDAKPEDESIAAPSGDSFKNSKGLSLVEEALAPDEAHTVEKEKSLLIEGPSD